MREQIKLKDLLEGHSEEESRLILKKFYDEQYQNGNYKPPNGRMFWQRFLTTVPKFSRGLDIGCGIGEGLALAKNRGYNIFGIDIGNASRHWAENKVKGCCCVASAIHLPFWNNAFDFVISNDVLEHIPEWDILTVLKEIYRVASRIVFLIISLEYEHEPIDGYIYSHLTVKPQEWWVEKIVESGFKVDQSVLQDSNHHLVAWLHKGE